MHNIETGVIETIGDLEPIVGVDTDYPWDNFGKKRLASRTENANLQDFGLSRTDTGTNNFAVSLDHSARTNSRMARTEIHTDGIYLMNAVGLQWYLLRADYNTKDRVSGSSYRGQYYQYHRSPEVGGEAWDDETAYKQRSDFSPGKRYYLIGIDPSHVYANACFRERGYTHNNYVRSWGFVCKMDNQKSLVTEDKIFAIQNSENSGRLVCYVSKLEGLDFVQGSNVWKNTGSHGGLEPWISNKLSRDLTEWKLKKEHKANASILEYDKPQILYARQFKGKGASNEIVRVGHLRFRRVADANPLKKGNSVIDLIEWYGIIPILNVPKAVSFDCIPEYFKHHTNSMCLLCSNDNLELQSGRYVIDIDSECMYYRRDYKYKYSKKAWILSSLANMRITIENDTIDRIIPIADDSLQTTEILVEDDDFLNRF